MRTARSVLCATAVAAFACGAPTAAAKPPDVDATRLEQQVTVEGVLEHQQALQEIADLHGGTRHTKTDGYAASAEYVKSTLEAAGYDARYEQFNMPEWHETEAPVMAQISPNPKPYIAGAAADDGSPTVDFTAFEHSPTAAGDGAGGADQRHPHRERGRLDERLRAEDYPDAVDGAIALIQRGTCGFTTKLQLRAPPAPSA